MKVLRITGRGGPEVLALADAPDPEPGPAELVVHVRAAGLNRADLLQCRGLYPAPPGAVQDVPGLEYAGEVVEVGPRVQRFKVGDRVMGLVAGGAFAERLAVHEREALPIPSSVGFPEAAAVPEAFITAFDALVLQGGLKTGDLALVHASGSGVGTAAVQVAAAVGAECAGTARSPEKLERCRALGLRHPLLVQGTPPRFAAALEERAGRKADVVLELVGPSYFPETLEACALEARILWVGMLGDSRADLDFSPLLRQRARLIGTTLRSRPIEEKIAVARAFEHQMLPLLAAGRLRPVIDAVLPMREVVEAGHRMAQNTTFGKLVLQWT